MKARLKFKKYGAVKFIGHLDLMRFFQKAFRRVGVDVSYSNGYSPHQLTFFASPLGVGITSDGEYMDMQLNSVLSEEEMVSLISGGLVEGIEIVNFHLLKDDSKKSMSVVAAADYKISVRDGYSFTDNFKEKFRDFMRQDQIVILKKTKKSETEVDIKPLIFGFGLSEEEFTAEGGHLSKESVATTFDNGNFVYLQLSSGSVDNLKPELVMEAFCQFAGIEFEPFAYQLHRIEVYANQVSKEELEEGKRNLVPLDQFEIME